MPHSPHYVLQAILPQTFHKYTKGIVAGIICKPIIPYSVQHSLHAIRYPFYISMGIKSKPDFISKLNIIDNSVTWCQDIPQFHSHRTSLFIL